MLPAKGSGYLHLMVLLFQSLGIAFTIIFHTIVEPRARLHVRKTGLSPQYFITDRSMAVLLL